MAEVKQHRVLIFDSGVGGLSVFQDIVRLMPSLEVVYAFDNEGYPYGELQPEVLIDRVVRYVDTICNIQPVDAVVIACNSASTLALPALRARFSIPVVGVVPALKPANQLAQRGITLLATPGTVARDYTHRLIEEFIPNTPVQLIGSTELVDMAESKLRGVPLSTDKLSAIVADIPAHSDVVVLGCTHFPLLKEELQLILGEQVKLIDSGEAIARRVAHVLNIAAPQQKPLSSTLRHRVFSSALIEASPELELFLERLGFNTIQLCPLPDA